MRFIFASTVLIPSLLAVSSSAQAQDEIAEINGPYLGQTPPGETAESFAPGIVNTEHFEAGAFFTPDMQEFYLVRSDGEYGEEFALVVFQSKDNLWRESYVMRRIGRPITSPDGKTMHLGSRYMERTTSGWSEVKSLGPMFERDDWGIMRLTSSVNGTYVFDDFKGGGVIRMSTIVNGERQEPVRLPEHINRGETAAHPFIAPDETYLIWDSKREGGYGESDLYISFRQHDGSWGEAINLGDKINTDAAEGAAAVTPDGKYLFFNRTISPGNADKLGNLDIYWVDAQIIETLRPE